MGTAAVDKGSFPILEPFMQRAGPLLIKSRIIHFDNLYAV